MKKLLLFSLVFLSQSLFGAAKEITIKNTLKGEVSCLFYVGPEGDIDGNRSKIYTLPKPIRYKPGKSKPSKYKPAKCLKFEPYRSGDQILSVACGSSAIKKTPDTKYYLEFQEKYDEKVNGRRQVLKEMKKNELKCPKTILTKVED